MLPTLVLNLDHRQTPQRLHPVVSDLIPGMGAPPRGGGRARFVKTRTGPCPYQGVNRGRSKAAEA